MNYEFRSFYACLSEIRSGLSGFILPIPKKRLLRLILAGFYKICPGCAVIALEVRSVTGFWQTLTANLFFTRLAVSDLCEQVVRGKTFWMHLANVFAF